MPGRQSRERTDERPSRGRGRSSELRKGEALFALDEFEEAALFTVAGFFLKQEREIAFFKLVEPVLPGDGLERAAAGETRKVDAENSSGFASGGARHRGRPTATSFRPFPDGVVVGGDVRGGGDTCP